MQNRAIWSVLIRDINHVYDLSFDWQLHVARTVDVKNGFWLNSSETHFTVNYVRVFGAMC